jgi:hypothetical protein
VKKTRFTEAQIVAILRELDAGVPVSGAGSKARSSREHDPALARQVRRHGNQRFSEA